MAVLLTCMLCDFGMQALIMAYTPVMHGSLRLCKTCLHPQSLFARVLLMEALMLGLHYFSTCALGCSFGCAVLCLCTALRGFAACKISHAALGVLDSITLVDGAQPSMLAASVLLWSERHIGSQGQRRECWAAQSVDEDSDLRFGSDDRL